MQLATPDNVTLRDVIASDLDIFFEQEKDPDAITMAAFTAKDPNDRLAFDAHWTKVMGDGRVTIQTILVDGDVAGSVLVHSWFGDPEISYWLGKEFWGKGIATTALEKFLACIPIRPLYARVVKDNLASFRVLEKCGFRIHGEGRGFANARGMEVEEWVLILVGNSSREDA